MSFVISPIFLMVRVTTIWSQGSPNLVTRIFEIDSVFGEFIFNVINGIHLIRKGENDFGVAISFKP